MRPRASRLLLLLSALALAVMVAEFGAGYWWWWTEHGSSALGSLVRRAAVGAAGNPEDLGNMVVRYSPRSPFVPDATLGFRLAPGGYTVRIQETGTVRHHTFRMTVGPDGDRRASPHPPRPGLPKVWLLGDSWVFGWGNDDHSTLAWFLQRYLPDREVRCFATPGYGNLHTLLQLPRLLETHPAPEAVVVAYADYFNERNAATPERLAMFRSRPEDFTPEHAVPRDFTHPRARLRQGALVIDHLPLFLPPSTETAVEPTPTLAEQHAITRRILEEIHSQLHPRRVRLVLAWLRGPDNDPVPQHAVGIGYTLADLRPRAHQGEWDDFRPFDAHPGPRAQAAFAAKLREALDPTPSATNHHAVAP